MFSKNSSCFDKYYNNSTTIDLRVCFLKEKNDSRCLLIYSCMISEYVLSKSLKVCKLYTLRAHYYDILCYSLRLFACTQSKSFRKHLDFLLLIEGCINRCFQHS